MANISKLLEKIKTAVYGKDMRQSLHDSIKSTNDDLEEFKATKAQANGLASLGSDGKIPDAQMPDLSIVDTFIVGSKSAMLSLNAQKGDFCIRTDENQLYVLKRSPANTFDNWHNFGVIVLNKSSIGLGNVDNTADIDKPISTAAQTAFNNIKNGVITINPSLGTGTEMSNGLLENRWLNIDIWDIISRFANHDIKTYKVSEVSTFWDISEPVFIIENDTDIQLTKLIISDDVDWILSTPIKPHDSRICILFNGGHGGANPADGSVFIMGDNVFKAYKSSLDLPLTYTLSDYGADGETRGDFIHITLQEDDAAPYDEYPGMCFGVDNEYNPIMWIYGDVVNPKRIATTDDINRLQRSINTLDASTLKQSDKESIISETKNAIIDEIEGDHLTIDVDGGDLDAV